MTNNESSCTEIGTSALIVIAIIFSLFYIFPVTMIIICSVMVAFCLIYYFSYSKNKRKQEHRTRAINLYKNYPHFFKAFYFQNISKEKIKEKDIIRNLDKLNTIFKLITDSQAEKWNKNIIMLEELDKTDHNYFLSLIQASNIIPDRKIKHLSVKPVYALPYEVTEKLASKTISQWIQEKKIQEQFNAFKRKYSNFLPNFLSDNPEIKTEQQILNSEDLLIKYINKHKQKLAYSKWKQKQNSLNSKIDSLSPIYTTSHIIKRPINIKSIGESKDIVNDIVFINQIAFKEYSNYSISEQSPMDLKCHNWVKSLSSCNTNFSKDIINGINNCIKTCTNDYKEKALIVFVMENFLNWNEQIMAYYYQQFANTLSNIDQCNVADFRDKIENSSIHFEKVFIIDLISNENQVYNISELLMSPYIQFLPNFTYISLVRELTEEEAQVRIEKEKQYRHHLLKYDTIAEEMPNGLTVWAATHPLAGKEEAINSEKDIQKIELSISADSFDTYNTYYNAIGMNTGCCIKETLNAKDEDSTIFIPLKDHLSIKTRKWSDKTKLGIEIGKTSTFRAIGINGLNPKMEKEINGAMNLPFVYTPNFDNLLHRVLSLLGLPLDYPWIIINEKGPNVYIIIKSGVANDNSIDSSICYINHKYLEQKQEFFIQEEEIADFSSLQIYWNGVQIMPPSMTTDLNSSKYYFWSMGIPNTQPIDVTTTKIDDLIYTFCSKIEYRFYTYNKKNLFLAAKRKIKHINDNGISKALFTSDSKSWIETSDSSNTNILKGINYAMGINGFEQNYIKALFYFNKAEDNAIAKYNIASLMACGIIPGDESKIKHLLTTIDKKMKYINVIKNNAINTFWNKEDDTKENI